MKYIKISFTDTTAEVGDRTNGALTPKTKKDLIFRSQFIYPLHTNPLNKNGNKGILSSYTTDGVAVCRGL